MTLQEIKSKIEYKLDIRDLSIRDRHRHKVYAKHIYYFIARKNGYGTIETAKLLNQTHAMSVYHIKQHHDKLDGDKFYKLVYQLVSNEKEFDLSKNQEKYINKQIKINVSKELKKVERYGLPYEILEGLSSLSKDEQKEFLETRLKPYLRLLKSRKL